MLLCKTHFSWHNIISNELTSSARSILSSGCEARPQAYKNLSCNKGLLPLTKSKNSKMAFKDSGVWANVTASTSWGLWGKRIIEFYNIFQLVHWRTIQFLTQNFTWYVAFCIIFKAVFNYIYSIGINTQDWKGYPLIILWVVWYSQILFLFLPQRILTFVIIAHAEQDNDSLNGVEKSFILKLNSNITSDE